MYSVSIKGQPVKKINQIGSLRSQSTVEFRPSTPSDGQTNISMKNYLDVQKTSSFFKQLVELNFAAFELNLLMAHRQVVVDVP